MPTFDVEGEPISITARDADRIVERLNANGSDAATNAAGKIERAMRLHESRAVSLKIGEDEVVPRRSANYGRRATTSPRSNDSNMHSTATSDANASRGSELELRRSNR
jgi:transcription elongation GreA/GreB family factor